uniref:Uncharacterized protein n=1 Tax=Globodera pallida TaxID=36090 RepID=A0A183C1R8_GLOPA
MWRFSSLLNQRPPRKDSNAKSGISMQPDMAMQQLAIALRDQHKIADKDNLVPVWQGGRRHVKQKLDTFVYHANDNPGDDHDKQTNDNHYGEDFGDHYGEASDENGETFWDYGQSKNDYGGGTNDYHGGKSQCTSQRCDFLHGADCDWNFGF